MLPKNSKCTSLTFSHPVYYICATLFSVHLIFTNLIMCIPMHDYRFKDIFYFHSFMQAFSTPFKTYIYILKNEPHRHNRNPFQLSITKEPTSRFFRCASKTSTQIPRVYPSCTALAYAIKQNANFQIAIFRQTAAQTVAARRSSGRSYRANVVRRAPALDRRNFFYTM